MELTEEQFNETEDYVAVVLSNEPSEMLSVDSYKIRVVFQRPSMVNKFKHRAWRDKKLKEIGALYESQDLTMYFNMWSQMNSHIKHVYLEDKEGDVTFDGTKYREYELTDQAFLSAIEQFTHQEVYEKGKSDEEFVLAVWEVYLKWVEGAVIPDTEDVKKS